MEKYTRESFEKDKEHRILSGMLLNVSDNCNMRCRYCEFVDYKRENMSIEVAEKAIDFLLRNTKKDKPDITFFGGEPMMNYPLIQYIVKKYKDKFNWNMTTNGTLLTKEKIEWLKENKVHILLSIDGDKETQDFNRPLTNGSSSFDKLKEVLHLIPSAFPGLTFRSTLYPQTSSNFKDNYNFAREQGFRNYFITPDEYSDWSDDSLLQNMQEGIANIIMQYIMDIRSIGTPLTRFSEIDKALIEVLSHKEIADPVQDTVLRRCGLGFHSIGVGTKGDIFACQEHSSAIDDDIFKIGNIFTGFDDEAHYRLAEEYTNNFLAAKQYEEKCRTCYANFTCLLRHCPSRNYLMKQTFNYKSYARCIWMKTLVAGATELNSFFEHFPSRNYEDFVQELLKSNGKELIKDGLLYSMH